MTLHLKPFGHRVILEPVTSEEEVMLPQGLKTINFKIKAGSEAGEDERALVAGEQGTIVAIGPLAWKHPDFGYGRVSDEEWASAWPKIGDKVVFGKYAGKIWPDPVTKKKYFVLDDEAIQMKILEE